MVINVTRTGDLSGAATIDYDTNDGTASERKDYEDSFHKYERELKVPYCLLFRSKLADLAHTPGTR